MTNALGALLMVVGLVAIMWIVGAVNIVLDYRLSEFGIVPRNIDGLRGIPLMPFLHVDFNHLVVNTLPVALLGTMVAIKGRGIFLMVTAFIVFVGGFALWVAGREAIHVGASGLIFGYVGYLIARAWYVRSIGAVLAAIVVIVLYGGALLGALPTTSGVSWEGHLTGLLAGGLAARVSKPGRRESESVRSADRTE